MRIPSGKTDQYINFVARDTSTRARKTGLTSFIVYRSRNGGAATVYTTPTVVELSAANMPGIYALLIDEDTTIASGSDSEEYVLHISATNMVSLTRAIELYRRDTTSGKTALIDASGRVDVAAVAGTAQTAKDLGASATQTGDNYARLGAPAGSSLAADVAAVKVDTAAVKAKTDSLTFTVAGQVDSNVVDWKGSAAPAMTGDAFARIGLAGAGLTALGDTRIAHLDADVSSRLASAGYTAPDNSSITAIKAKTDNLPSDPADASDIAGAFGAVNATLATIAGYLDTEVGAIKAKTDNLPSDPASITVVAAQADALAVLIDGVASNVTSVKTKTDSLSFGVAGKVDANITHVNEVEVTGDGTSGTEWGPA